MKKRVVSMLLAVVMMLGMFPGTALAAGSVEEALGEVNIYNGEQKLSYLSINGRVRELIYTYYNYVDRNGQTKEIPAYCVNPNIKGVPQTVAPGESIKYLANEIGSDPKVMGIIANGYPHRSLSELKLENKYQAFPRKMADASSSPKMVSTSTVRSTFTTKSMTTTPFVPLSLARASALSILMMMATAKSAPALL